MNTSKKFRCPLVALIGVLLLQLPSPADVILEFDMDLDRAGTQANRVAGAGEIFEVDLLMNVTGSNEVSAFSASVNFDVSEVGVSAVDTSNRPVNFTQFSEIVIDNVSGLLAPFDTLNLSASTLGPGTTTRLGRIRLEVLSPLNDGIFDLEPLVRNNGIDGILDSGGLPIFIGSVAGDGGVFFRGGSISAVPEPSSLMLTGLVALAAVVSRRSLRR